VCHLTAAVACLPLACSIDKNSPTFLHGSFEETDAVHGQALVPICEPGYELYPTDVLATCSCLVGGGLCTFAGDFECTTKSCQTGTVWNGAPTSSTALHGTVVRMACNEGYESAQDAICDCTDPQSSVCSYGVPSVCTGNVALWLTVFARLFYKLIVSHRYLVTCTANLNINR
jgi:hypothetical protein